MRRLWVPIVVVLALVALGFAVVCCPLFDSGSGQAHTALEVILGETPRAKVEAYLDAVGRGDREAALALWPGIDSLGPDYDTRRREMTRDLLALGPPLGHQVLEAERWRNCPDPGLVEGGESADMVRMRVQITGADIDRMYIFDVALAQPWGVECGVVQRFPHPDAFWRDPLSQLPVRRWLLRDVYSADEQPLAFAWPQPTATPVPVATPTPAATPTAQPPEDVLRNMSNLRARLSPFHPEGVHVVSWEKVDWPDGCLGIPMRDPCTEAVVPGYRFVVEVEGQEYEYHCTLADARPHRLLLASGPGPGIEEPALLWEGQMDHGWEQYGCESLLLAADGRAAIGPCDAPHEPLHLADNPYRQFARLELWDHWLDRFAPFEAETPSGLVVFQGEGTEEASPAWQRAIAAWARWAWGELWSGRSGAGWALALLWYREIPEHPGYCHLLMVGEYGMAYASVGRCDLAEKRELGRGWLETEELEQFDSWYYGRAAVHLREDVDFSSIGSQEMSQSEVEALRLWAATVYDRLTAELTVEEYAIVAQEVDTPDHFEYSQRIPAEAQEKRRVWREPTTEERVAGANQALAPFGYRLVVKEKPGWHYPFYDLYKDEVLVESDLSTIWPISVNASGDDFALVAEPLNRAALLIHRNSVEEWEMGRHCYTAPVFVGDDLVTVEMDEQHGRYEVRQADRRVYDFTYLVAPGPRADNPVKGLWSWGGAWVLEVDGHVVVDGQSLNEETGYEEIFGWRLLSGQPFYFFKKEDHIGISYGDQILPYQYEEVIHYACCEPAAFNVRGNETMVWFHALRDGMWYYVEMGVYP